MARLGDCFCVIRNGASIKQMDDSGGLPITRIETISNREVDRSKLGYAGIKDAQKYQDYLLQDCDILMSHINSTKHLGKVAIYRKKENEQIIHGMNLLMLRANQSVICPQYAFYYFDSDDFKRQILRITKNSVNQASFTVTTLKELKIPLPTLGEQRKIAAVLDKISDLVAKRRRQLDKLDELVKSRFVEMFGDPVINEKNWPKYKISDFATVKIGPFGSMLHADDYVRGGHPMVNPSHISDGVIIPDFSLSLNVQKQEELVAYQLLPGDVIIGRRGEIGRCAVVKKSGMFCGTGCMFVRIFKDCRPDYLQRVISYPTFSSILEDKAVGVTMKNLNAGMVEDSNVYLPPLSMQDKFASFRAQVDTLKLRIGSSVDKLDTLKKSLMQEYFSVR